MSQKRDSEIIYRNWKTGYQILIIFGMYISDTTI